MALCRRVVGFVGKEFWSQGLRFPIAAVGGRLRKALSKWTAVFICFSKQAPITAATKFKGLDADRART